MFSARAPFGQLYMSRDAGRAKDAHGVLRLGDHARHHRPQRAAAAVLLFDAQ